MHASALLASVRARAGLTLRELARRASTSHSTLSAYESGAKVPTVATLDRIVRAAGFVLDPTVSARVRGDDRLDRGAELAAVLELAEAFPTRYHATLRYPVFPAEPR